MIALKATAGGGGRGMRLAKEPDEFVKLLQVLVNAICLTARIPYFVLHICIFFQRKKFIFFTQKRKQKKKKRRMHSNVLSYTRASVSLDTPSYWRTYTRANVSLDTPSYWRSSC